MSVSIINGPESTGYRVTIEYVSPAMDSGTKTNLRMYRDQSRHRRARHLTSILSPPPLPFPPKIIRQSLARSGPSDSKREGGAAGVSLALAGLVGPQARRILM